MASNINLNLNQSPYFDDYDETKDFHQVLYKPAVAVQARELTQEQTILRNQLKRFGDHIFANDHLQCLKVHLFQPLCY